MKKFIPFLSLAFLVAACNSNPESANVKTLQSAQQPVQDTAGLAAFQQWKAQNELASATQPQQTQTKPAEAAPVKTVEVVREVRVVEKPAPVHKKQAVLNKEPEPTKTTEKTLPTTDNNTTAQGNGSGTTDAGSADGKVPAAGQETAKKEGWSKAAKGATIGGVGGAVLGGVINKRNRAAGAVIGGILGAGVGYGIGKTKDRKDTSN